MLSFGETIRKQREEKGLPLRVIAAYLEIDPAVLSKIETGKMKASRDHVVKLARYFKTNEKDLLAAWLADKLVYEAGDEEVALQAMKMAEEKIEYKVWESRNNAAYRKRIRNKIEGYLRTNRTVSKAWLFGSFAREDDTPKSDIDIAIDVFAEAKFTLFDIAEIQEEIEKAINRKVDVVMINGVWPTVKERINKDLQLIYEA